MLLQEYCLSLWWWLAPPAREQKECFLRDYLLRHKEGGSSMRLCQVMRRLGQRVVGAVHPLRPPAAAPPRERYLEPGPGRVRRTAQHYTAFPQCAAAWHGLGHPGHCIVPEEAETSSRALHSWLVPPGPLKEPTAWGMWQEPMPFMLGLNGKQWKDAEPPARLVQLLVASPAMESPRVGGLGIGVPDVHMRRWTLWGCNVMIECTNW